MFLVVFLGVLAGRFLIAEEPFSLTNIGLEGITTTNLQTFLDLRKLPSICQKHFLCKAKQNQGRVL